MDNLVTVFIGKLIEEKKYEFNKIYELIEKFNIRIKFARVMQKNLYKQKRKFMSKEIQEYLDIFYETTSLYHIPEKYIKGVDSKGLLISYHNKLIYVPCEIIDAVGYNYMDRVVPLTYEFNKREFYDSFIEKKDSD